ncbi:terminase family protein [Bradyrhizobium sp. 30]|uniref:terminase large subunit domain-containing protein n=1 Tax=Bradyrhizobium sp. 30 TaxID=2782669 RepID=UPI001FF89314|nr:terminase family protein [Bradyrhizobium sp. 30]
MTRVRPPLIILDAVADDKLFAPWFKDRATWKAWSALLAALFGLRLTDEQLAIYRECTGRDSPPTEPASEAWLVCGRRAGKSFVLALIAVYLAAFHDYRRHLSPGERGTVLVIATDRKQARTIFRYIRALLTQVPMLSKLIEREDRETIDLSNSVTIEVGTASFKSVRGYTIVAALCDEIAFWPTDDSAQPDYEILDALRPGMATIPNAMLLCASSPYARRGALWDAHRRHFGKDGDPTLVWQAPTRTMNSSVPQRVIDEATERDPASAAAEYGAQFRSDVESFVNREAVEACVSVGIQERSPISGVTYSGFVDPSGGSADSMTLAIGHWQDDVVVIDAVRERRPPFNPEDVVREFAAILKSYRISTVTGDRYAGEWPRERLREQGIAYDLATKPKSDLYREFLPAINSRMVDLLEDARLFAQIIGLERRAARGGKDSIDHAPGAHDDLANSVAGVVASLASTGHGYDSSMEWVSGPEPGQGRSLWEHPYFNGGRSRW